jgi:hypothetical protein
MLSIFYIAGYASISTVLTTYEVPQRHGRQLSACAQNTPQWAQPPPASLFSSSVESVSILKFQEDSAIKECDLLAVFDDTQALRVILGATFIGIGYVFIATEIPCTTGEVFTFEYFDSSAAQLLNVNEQLTATAADPVPMVLTTSYFVRGRRTPPTPSKAARPSALCVPLMLRCCACGTSMPLTLPFDTPFDTPFATPLAFPRHEPFFT